MGLQKRFYPFVTNSIEYPRKLRGSIAVLFKKYMYLLILKPKSYENDIVSLFSLQFKKKSYALYNIHGTLKEENMITGVR